MYKRQRKHELFVYLLILRPYAYRADGVGHIELIAHVERELIYPLKRERIAYRLALRRALVYQLRMRKRCRAAAHVRMRGGVWVKVILNMARRAERKVILRCFAAQRVPLKLHPVRHHFRYNAAFAHGMQKAVFVHRAAVAAGGAVYVIPIGAGC